MTYKTMIRSLLIVIGASIFSFQARSQGESDLVQYLSAGQQDASKLIGAYMSPVVEGLSYGMNGGWYHTAKAHKTLGFDLGVSLNAVFIPTSKNYFDPASLDLQTVSVVPQGAMSPTMVGPKETSEFHFNGDQNNDRNFDGPEGLDFKKEFKVSGVVAPTAQLGIGIYKNTDLKIRYMPEIEAGQTKIKLIGFGVLHDIKQHIPGIKLLPFDLSVFAGFTKVNGVSGLSNPEKGFDPRDGDTRPQQIDYEMNALLFQALISKKFSVVTFYGGIGYNSIKTTANMTGSYRVRRLEVENGPEVYIDNPFSQTFKQSSMRLTAGVRFKFGPIYLNGDYSLQSYSTLSVGLGVSVR